MAFITSQAVLAKAIQANSVSASAIGDPYAVDGFEPELAFDFTGESYRTDGSATTFSGAMTHSATSLGTMVDEYGPELAPDFSSYNVVLTGTWSDAGNGAYQFVDTIGGQARPGVAWSSSTLVEGKAYEATVDVKSITGAIQIRLDYTPSDVFLNTGINNFTFVATALNAASGLRLRIEDGATTINDGFTLNSISVREVPAIKWRPHNLLTYSEDFSQWTKVGSTVSGNATVAPDVTQTADLISETSATSEHYAYNTIVAVTGTFTYSAWLKPSNIQYVILGERSTTGAQACFNLSDGSVRFTVLCTATIVEGENGWFFCSMTPTSSFSAQNFGCRVQLDNNGLNDGNSYAGDTSNGVYIYGAHLYRSDLGGMVDNPDRGDSYVPTAARVLPSAPELVTNGHFNTNVIGWTAQTATISWDASGALSSTTSGYAQGAYQNITTTIGKTYIVTASSTSASILHRLRINAGSYAGTILVESAEVSTPTTFTLTFTATSTTTTVYLRSSAAGTVLWDNISIKESYIDPSVARYLPRRGHYVYNDQAWTNRGLLLESEARTNLETKSEDYSTFPNLNVGSRNVDATGPDGQTSATTIIANSAGGTGNVAIYSGDYTVSTSTAHTFSVFLKAGTLDWAGLYTINFTTPAIGGTFFDLANGVVGNVASGHTANIQDVGSGWYRCSITFTTDATDTSGQCRVYLADGDSDADVPLDGVSSILVYGVQFEEGSTPSSYMPTNGATFTRAAETLTVAAADLPSTISPSGGKAALVAAGWTITDGGSV